ncbi:DNA mismatch repair endonuclease MutL [Bulleidia sp. zg-1006]|uniref:DNA mismatch repair endonuclease MutL n=1 Tax=Bulleidia sp. zg-1006 TaxID=2806552 RepID=UPI00193A50E8|nr:DNA mismatch repair endonuclease MutL [Bulleidia sp. zg-1006]QRG86688.1 DNA mismatch repair endonuclease MutL [Bulleidia sp. zg-1006]
MARIKQLDAHVANMIAAGEVVERPSGIVKELVENAIDAQSTKIKISIEEGGITKIRVEDNGVGMDGEDLVNCFKRHATSKIFKEADLWSIHSLGFRGEALPSIASVSKVSLISHDGKNGHRIVVQYGEQKTVESYPCNQGTDITVEGLFYQTPARLKHMRSAAYEASLVLSTIHKFALAYPSISFSFISDDKVSFQSTGSGNLKEVIFLVYGRAVAENLVPFEFQDQDFHVHGYGVKPLITRSSRNHMHLFFNGRMVRQYRLDKAIQHGYEDFIVKGRYPIVVLSMEVDPHLMDVNVHPSKWEIRLSKLANLEELIEKGIRKSLKGTSLAAQVETTIARQEVYYTQSQMDFKTPVQEETVEWNVQPPVEQESFEFPKQEEPVYEERETSLPDLQVIGQLHDKFILCAYEEGLAILDQHAAQERVHFEEYVQKLNQNPSMQDLLVPIMLHSDRTIVERVKEVNEALKDLHIELEAFGQDSFVLRTVPVWLKELEIEAFLQDVLDEFKNEQEIKYARLERKHIATLACHHSIRFNHSLTMEEMKEAVRQLYKCENPYHCPHGRPTIIFLKEKELAKEFYR